MKKKKLIDIKKLISKYYSLKPETKNPNNIVKFGTSGHRGSSFKNSFNEYHILAITQAIVDFRKSYGIFGPCLVGKDTHALSFPAFMTVVEVLIGNGVDVFIQRDNDFTPTPSISFNILNFNYNNSNKADGIILTSSHNPPEDGGIKYNLPNGGPACELLTSQIESRANKLIKNNLFGIHKLNYNIAIKNSHCYHEDFIEPYVNGLDNVVDMEAIQKSGLKIGIDPFGSSGVNYWKRISEYYQFDLKLISENIDPTFSFVPLDFDGIVRIDCTSSAIMKRLLNLKNKFDLCFSNDPDCDRYGIITPLGLMDSNSYLAVIIRYLFNSRLSWKRNIFVGKTVVSSVIIDRVVYSLGKKLIELPVGFKWFSNGLYEQIYAIAGEESGGASFVKFDGSPWTTDKDGIVMCLLAAEITSITEKNPQEHYEEIINSFGKTLYSRIQMKINENQEKKLKKINSNFIFSDLLASYPIVDCYSHAPGNGAYIGGIKVITDFGWFAARPSGTEGIYKIYCESFLDSRHLELIKYEAIKIIESVLI